MVWNHRDKLSAMAVTIQAVPGTFNTPNTTTDLIAAANIENGPEMISAPDPTQTGTVWDQPRTRLGKTGTGGATIPLRGPGGGAVPAANAWAFGRLMQACGFTELRLAAAVPAALQTGSTTSALVLANTESAVDDFLVGHPIQQVNIGTGFRKTSIVRDYVGSTKTAHLAETLGVAPIAAAAYIRPAFIGYLLGTLITAPPLLSISVWRGRRRYDYRDCVITGWALDTPVANESNQSSPALQFQFKGTPLPSTTEVAPALPSALVQVPVPPVKAGKFFLDKIMLGHAGAKVNINLETGAAPNQNQDAGQDGQDILGGSRNVELDLNQMDVADFDIEARENSQVNLPYLSTWGLGVGNDIGLMIPNVVLDDSRPNGRNGYVGLSGQAQPTDVDKSIALAFWYDGV